MTEQSGRVRGTTLGMGAAACAVCCAPPVIALLGIASGGVIATIATVAFAGLAFGLVVALATIATLIYRRRQRRQACAPDGDSVLQIPPFSAPRQGSHARD